MTITTVGYKANPKVKIEKKIHFSFSYDARVFWGNLLAVFVHLLESLQSPCQYP